jgi:hypothetical protein
MAQAYFHCLSTRGAMLDQCEADLDDLTEAHEYATAIVQSLIAMPCLEDWRNWALHVSDELGQEILVMPFSSILGWPH